MWITYVVATKNTQICLFSKHSSYEINIKYMIYVYKNNQILFIRLIF